MEKSEVKEWLRSLSAEEQAEFGIGTSGGEADEYAEQLMQKMERRMLEKFGGVWGTSAAHTAMSKLTDGLSDGAKAIIKERLKDKPAEHLLALSSDDAYAQTLRDGAEYHAGKEAEKAAATTEKEDVAGEGKKTAATAEVQEFMTTMKDKMGVEFTEEEARSALEDVKSEPQGVL